MDQDHEEVLLPKKPALRVSVSLWLVILCVLALSPCRSRLVAQPLDRLTGKVITERGEPMNDADIRVEALFGFAGSDFLGQRTFSARTNEKGTWALLAFKAGIWIFDAWAPGRLPDAVALPFNLVVPPGSGIAGVVPVWHPILRLVPVPDDDIGRMLDDAADAARAGRPERATPLLSRLSDSGDVNVLVAAGRICLLMRDPTVARPFFRRALDRDPKSFAAALGMGSTALMQRDVDAAGRAFSEARALTREKDERSYLSAAVAELNKAHYVMRGTY
jgi:tetratricopeptide repeat protein